MENELNAMESVLNALRDDIINGKRPGGSRVVEQSIAEEFGISRVPVRDAIHALIIEGLVDRHPRHGGRVHVMTRSDIADISELHGTFDVLAVRLAATRRTEHELEVFRQDVARARDAANAGDQHELMAAGSAFRRHSYEASGNRPLFEIYQALRSRTRLMFTLNDVRIATPIVFYDQLLSAFEQRDADAARAAMEGLGENVARARQERVLQELASGTYKFSVSAAEALQPPVGAYTPDSVAVRNRLRDEIISGLRQPGTIVSERKLADEFGVSRGPARRAIEDLAYEGLVDLGPSRRSSRVRGTSEEEQSDLFDVASTLDVLATRLAAQRPGLDELAKLHELLLAEQKISAKNLPAVLDSLFAFRRQIYLMSGNRLILEVNRMFESRMRMMVSNAPLADVVRRGHQLLFEAISARDNVLAEAVYRETFERAEHRGGILANVPSW